MGGDHRRAPASALRTAGARADRELIDCRGKLCDRGRRRANSCRHRSKQRHNAGCPAFEVRIRYPFHPRFGRDVSVVFRRRFAGEEHLVVVQPDGTLALIPSWMAEEPAGSTVLTAHPRLSLGRLIELRTRLDALLACSRGESAPFAQGGEHASSVLPAKRFFRTGSANPGDSKRNEAGDHSPDRGPSRRSHGRRQNGGAIGGSSGKGGPA